MNSFNFIKIIFVLLFILISISSHSQSCPVYAEYLFSGNADDSSGNGLNGTVIGATLTTDRLGNSSSAYDFDGSNDRIDLPEDFDFPQRTWSLWFKADNITSTPKVIFDSDHPGIENSQTQLIVREVGGVDMVTFLVGDNPLDVPITVEEWHHVAIIVDNVDISYYLNCLLVGTATNSSNVHSIQGQPTVSLGVNRFHSGNYFDGAIDDVKIFDCALSEFEIQDLGNCNVDDCSNFPCGKNNQKVLVCHVPPGNPSNAHEICISPNALSAHLAHGDYCGPCNVANKIKQTNMLEGGNSSVGKRIAIYPNPFINTFTIELNHNTLIENDNIEIKIYDLNGRILKTISKLSSDWVEIDMSKLNSGLYIYDIRSEIGIIETGKIMKE